MYNFVVHGELPPSSPFPKSKKLQSRLRFPLLPFTVAPEVLQRQRCWVVLLLEDRPFDWYSSSKLTDCLLTLCFFGWTFVVGNGIVASCPNMHPQFSICCLTLPSVVGYPTCPPSDTFVKKIYIYLICLFVSGQSQLLPRLVLTLYECISVCFRSVIISWKGRMKSFLPYGFPSEHQLQVVWRKRNSSVF